MNLYKYFSFFLLLGFLGACAATDPRQEIPAGVPTETILNDNLTQLKTSAEYKLQPGDLLEIQVFMEKDMLRTLRISTGGTITYPLVGNIQIAGLSVSQAEKVLAVALEEYIKDPQVSLLIKEYGNHNVYVLGQVAKPAALALPPEKPLTLLEAITSVGGFTDLAAISKVRVLRMENGQQTALDVDVAQITKQGNKALDMVLQAGDIVFVPQSMF